MCQRLRCSSFQASTFWRKKLESGGCFAKLRTALCFDGKPSKPFGQALRPEPANTGVPPGTIAHGIYCDVVTERHRHRYEANEKYLQRLQDAGLVISAITQREKLTEMVELPREVHPWFVGVQFHPEFKSTPWDGHPLFISYIEAALQHKKRNAN